MASVFDVKPAELVTALATELKGRIKAPAWAIFVKTGTNKERPPANPDLFFIRAASVLRTIFKSENPVGVSRLRSVYGSAKSRGLRPPRFTRASGNIHRKILQQLESAGLLKQKKEGVHKGRIITPAGAGLLERVAAKIAKQAK